MKLIEVGTGYTSIPASMGAATEIVVEELCKVFENEKVNYEIFDIKDEKRQDTNLRIKEVYVPKFFRKKDVSLGIVHKLKRVVYSINLAMALKKEIKNTKDKLVIHFHNQYNMFFYLKLVPKKLDKKVITVYTVHNGTWNGEWDNIKNKLKKKYFQEIYCIKNADKVFVLNKITKKHFVEQLKINPEKIIIIANGVNTDIYKQSKKSRSDDIIFFQCGSVLDNKNQLESIKMLKPYLQENKNYKYVYVGGIVDQKYKDKIDEYVKKNQLEEQIEYVGEIEPGEELSKYYKKSKAFIFPSKVEAFSLSIMEAMSSGLPIIMNSTYISIDIDKVKDIILFYKDEKSFDYIIKNKIKNESERVKIANLSRQVIAHKYLKEFDFEN